MTTPKKPFICGACNKRLSTIDAARSHAHRRHRHQRAVYIFKFAERIVTSIEDEA